MTTALWIVSGMLAAVFLAAGLFKLSQPKEKLAARLAWVNDFSERTVKLIGAVEVLGAIGLILPAATGIAPVLTPLAAVGLAITMVLAAVVHARRREPQMIIGNVILFALAAIVAILRLST